MDAKTMVECMREDLGNGCELFDSREMALVLDRVTELERDAQRVAEAVLGEIQDGEAGPDDVIVTVKKDKALIAELEHRFMSHDPKITPPSDSLPPAPPRVPPLGAVRRCPKCGGDTLNLRYIRASRGPEDVYRPAPLGLHKHKRQDEHLDVKCTTCGYAWEAPTEDAIPAKFGTGAGEGLLCT